MADYTFKGRISKHIPAYAWSLDRTELCGLGDITRRASGSFHDERYIQMRHINAPTRKEKRPEILGSEPLFVRETDGNG